MAIAISVVPFDLLLIQDHGKFSIRLVQQEVIGVIQLITVLARAVATGPPLVAIRRSPGKCTSTLTITHVPTAPTSVVMVFPSVL